MSNRERAEEGTPFEVRQLSNEQRNLADQIVKEVLDEWGTNQVGRRIRSTCERNPPLAIVVPSSSQTPTFEDALWDSNL
ncbi:hypothetical protein HYW84_00465 [Candidatus Peregrinibacteria bacterium]|nr:hypothetical protein [Candidatus Peregrinibacteria bacterium]